MKLNSAKFQKFIFLYDKNLYDNFSKFKPISLYKYGFDCNAFTDRNVEKSDCNASHTIHKSYRLSIHNAQLESTL